MDVHSRGDLRAEVESIAERLNQDLGRLFGEPLVQGEAREEPDPSSGSGAGPTRIPPELSRRALLNFWSAGLESRHPFLDAMPGCPSTSWAALHRSGVETLRRQVAPTLSPFFLDLRQRFSEILVLDAARLDDIAHQLRLLSEEGPLPLSGHLTALYDVSRGFAWRVWFRQDQEWSAPLEPRLVMPGVKAGSLILADESAATAEMFQELERVGGHGLFRIGKGGDLRPGDPSPAALEELPLLDVEVGLPVCPGRRLRRVSLAAESRGWSVLTDVLDPAVLPARAALKLAVPRWRVSRIFSDLAGVVDLQKLARLDGRELEPQVYHLALLGAVLRAGQVWIAQGRGLPPAALAPEFIFSQLVELAAAQASSGKGAGAGPSSPSRNGHQLIATFDPAVESRSSTNGAPVVVEPAAAPARRRPPQPASREEMMSIGTSVLHPAFERFARAYAEVGHRDGFLWKWVQRGLELTTLPSINPDQRGPNLTVKLLGVMLDVLLDDVADNLKDGAFLSALLKVPFSPSPLPPPALSAEKSRYHDFVVEVWAEIARIAEQFPRYGELREVFDFDYRQLLNTMSYAFLVNRIPEMLNQTEHDLYQPHNMHMMISGTLDLMCSAGFQKSELAPVRQALWRGQMMGRIGNMVSTWEREIKERDFTSGVFAAAIERGVVSAAELPGMAPAVLTRTIEESGVIQHFLGEWERLRDEVYVIAERVRSVDLVGYAAGLEELIRNHLGSRGLK